MPDFNANDEPVCDDRFIAEDGHHLGCSLPPGHRGVHEAYWDHDLGNDHKFICEWPGLDLPMSLEPVEVERWLADGAVL